MTSEAIPMMLSQMARVIRGKDSAIRDALTCLLAGGHLLIEDIPGVGKTTLAHALARCINGTFSRIQFTSDLLPSDVLGVSIYHADLSTFTFHAGPVFSHLVLADEINRSSPRTQSSLLECMERQHVSIDGQTHPLPRPFMVVATQNPLDFEGTYPLPENQLDRFLMRIRLGYPDRKSELAILAHPNHHYDHIDIEAVVSPQTLCALQAACSEVFIEATVLDYLLRLVENTRQSPALRLGVSPRGAIALKRAAQARAMTEGRSYVMPADLQALFLPVCAHRILPADSDPSEMTSSVPAAEACLSDILRRTPVP
jgi:MoxR-like ATPase